VAEAERMGFRQAIVPAGSTSGSSGGSAMVVTEVEDVRDALKAAFSG
jgi:predicted ATP-dependent serine protease